MFCKKCGNTLAENAKFCRKCGEKVSTTEEKTTMPISQVYPIVETLNATGIESMKVNDKIIESQHVVSNYDDTSTVHPMKIEEIEKTPSNIINEQFEENKLKYYNEAVDKMQIGNYREALNIFKLIDDYKNYKNVNKLASECLNKLKIENLSNSEYQYYQQIMQEYKKYAEYKTPGKLQWFLFILVCIPLGFFLVLIIAFIVNEAISNVSSNVILELCNILFGLLLIVSPILAPILGRVLLKRRIKKASEKHQLYVDAKTKLDSFLEEMKEFEKVEGEL
jgi:hypothetical protein